MEPFIIRNTKGVLVDLRSNIFDSLDLETLKRINRFAARINYSVEDHIKLGLKLCSTDIQKKFWILHEMFEGFSGLDIPKPLKASWEWYSKREKEYLEFVYKFHNLDYSEYAFYVYDIDNECYEIEADHFFNKKESIMIFDSINNNIPLLEIYKELFKLKS